MIKMPAIETLAPKAFAADKRIVYFPSGNTDLVKIDFLFGAGPDHNHANDRAGIDPAPDIVNTQFHPTIWL